MDVPGMAYLPAFLSQGHHDALLAAVDQQPWLTDLKRRTQHYGYKYDYTAKSVNKDMMVDPLPPWAEELAQMLYDDRIMDSVADQMIVNEYMPGQGIANHVDCVPCFNNVVVSVSLGSPCVMNFTKIDQWGGSKNDRTLFHTKIKTKEVVPMVLEPRSVLMIRDDARYRWLHGIPARKKDTIGGVSFERQRRVSLTFRTVILVEEV